jgi:hypothetical protein
MSEADKDFVRLQVDIQLYLGICIGFIALAGAFLIAGAQLFATNSFVGSLFFILTAAFGLLAVITVLVAGYYRKQMGNYSKKEKNKMRKKEIAEQKPASVNENIEKNKDGWTFFMGVMVGFVASVVATSLFEFSKLVLPSGVGYGLLYWGIMFFTSSIVFFWLIKGTLIKLGVNVDSRAFGIVTGVCAAIGLFMMGFGLLQI